MAVSGIVCGESTEGTVLVQVGDDGSWTQVAFMAGVRSGLIYTRFWTMDQIGLAERSLS